MLITAMLMAGALTTGDPDGVVATAPATAVDLGATRQPVAPSVVGAAQAGVPHNLTTDEQIDRWIATRAVDDRPYERVRGELLDDRLPHSEVSVSVGTGGYRDYGAAVSLPIGENGRLSLSYRQTENAYPYGGYGYGYGYDQSYGGAALDDGGYVFPGYRPGAAAQFEARVMRPDGPPNRRPLVRQDRVEP
ncbi:hypothetical protein [Brevundimonas sp.]|uniref:hypothetical protein n=1 Tax=Brevundimonas sp. TaxID=1871086 RepID=UPI002FC58918